MSPLSKRESLPGMFKDEGVYMPDLRQGRRCGVRISWCGVAPVCAFLLRNIDGDQSPAIIVVFEESMSCLKIGRHPEAIVCQLGRDTYPLPFEKEIGLLKTVLGVGDSSNRANVAIMGSDCCDHEVAGCCVVANSLQE